MKVIKKTWTFRSSYYFCIFLSVYYYIIFCLSKNHTTLSLKSIESFAQEASIVGVIFLLVTLTKSRPKLFFYPFVALQLAILTSIFKNHASMDKYFIISFFLASSFAFFYTLMLFHELKAPIYNPRYDKRDLDENGQFKRIACVLTTEEGIALPGFITNWDEDSAFVKLQSVYKLRGDLVVNLKGLKTSVAQAGSVYTSYNDGKGYGLVLFAANLESKSAIRWNDFHDRLIELGI